MIKLEDGAKPTYVDDKKMIVVYIMRREIKQENKGNPVVERGDMHTASSQADNQAQPERNCHIKKCCLHRSVFGVGEPPT